MLGAGFSVYRASDFDRQPAFAAAFDALCDADWRAAGVWRWRAFLTADGPHPMVVIAQRDEADLLLDIHSMHEPCAPLLLTGLQPRNVALALALRSGAHVVVDGGHGEGVRLRDFGRFGLPDAQAGDGQSLLVECGHHADPASRTVAQDLCARFLVAAGVLDAAAVGQALAGWRQADAAAPPVLEVTGGVVARSERFRFLAPFQGLELIARAGTVIGDNDGEPVVTPHDDCVLVMPSTRQARRGVTVVRFARRRPQ
jgi:hypothetical protein